MRKKNAWLFVMLSLYLFSFSGCLGDRETKVNPANKAPVAKLTVESKGDLVAGNPVVLDGSLSRDPDGDKIEYRFEVNTPNGETLRSTDSSLPGYAFVPTEEGHYSAELTVIDRKDLEGAHTVQLVIKKLEVFPKAPPNDARNVPINLKQLQWECNGCTDTKYQVYFITGDSIPYLIIEGISEKKFAIGNLPYNTICSWRVVANNNGCVADTGIMKFHTAETNSPPIVEIVASKDMFIEGDIVGLSAKIEDADDESFNYEWELLDFPSGSSVYEVDAPFDANTSFQADANGVYTVRLTVVDENGGEGIAEKSITVEKIRIENQSPVPNSTNQALNLTISWSCNAENAIFKIKFGAFSKFSEAEIYELDRNTTFSPDDLKAKTVYCAQVIIDNNGIIRTLPVNHSDWKFTTGDGIIENRPPIVNAGQNQHASLGGVVIFDASESSDPDGDELTYYWEVVRPSGGNISLEDSNQPTIWFFAEEEGIYIGTVTISDGREQASDTVEATVSGNNQKPIAEIRASKTEISLGESLNLDGSYSYDPEGESISYEWQLEGAGELYDANAPVAMFISNTAGNAKITLTVSDGQTNSDPVDIEIIVRENSVEELYLREIIPNGIQGVPMDSVITWQSNGEAFDVFFSFDEGNNFNLVSELQPGKSFSLTSLNLEAGKRYFYSVIAYRGDDYVVSDLFFFLTAPEQNEDLYLNYVYPRDGATDVPINGTMEWESNGDEFDIYMGIYKDSLELVISKTTEHSLDLTKVGPHVNTRYYYRIVAFQGEESVTGPIAEFRTGSETPPPPPPPVDEWVGIDVTLRSDGMLEIRNYREAYLTDEGRAALDNGAVPVFEGDVTLWNIGSALSAPCSFSNGTLIINLAKAPLIVNTNSFTVNLEKDGARVAYSQFHLLPQDDQEIILRKRAGTNDFALAVNMRIEDEEKSYSPCEPGEVPVRMAH